jgi:hypothetical protein
VGIVGIIKTYLPSTKESWDVAKLENMLLIHVVFFLAKVHQVDFLFGRKQK